jgi:hypothetical protein
MSKLKFTTWKYIDPDTNEHYMTITEQWDDIYDGEWNYETNKKIIIVKIKKEDNYLQ